MQSSRLLRGGRPSVAARALRVTRGAHSSCVLSHTSPHRSHVRPTTFCCIGSSVTSSIAAACAETQQRLPRTRGEASATHAQAHAPANTAEERARGLGLVRRSLSYFASLL